MAQKGRAFLRTDGGSRDVDRLVKREVSLIYYPTSTSADNPLEATFVLFDEGRKVRVVVSQRTNDGTATIFDEIVPT